jgi:phosphoserine phosphatase
VRSLRLILLRHGETAWNRERRFQGWQDVPLSPEGRVQAERTARALAESGATAVYASPLGRAQETAALIAKPHRLAVTSDAAFQEISFGAWEGLTPDEVQARFGALWAAWRAAPHTVRFPGGEDLATAGARALGGVARLAGSHPGQTVLLVSHGVIVRLIVLDALGLGPERLWAVHAAPGGVSEIEYRAGSATVHRMNTLWHLEAPLEP